MAFQSKYTGSQVEALLDKVNTGTLDVWLPSVTTAGQISWTKSNSQTVPATRNIMGPVGPTGPAGEGGGIGPIGPTGPKGNDGGQGPVGPTGPTGPQGSGGAGSIGPTGPTGPQGKPGSDGGVGLTGPTGPTGPVNNSLWYPTVAANGDISWAKSTSATTPTARNIRGPIGLTGPTGPAGAPAIIGKIPNMTVDFENNQVSTNSWSLITSVNVGIFEVTQVGAASASDFLAPVNRGVLLKIDGYLFLFTGSGVIVSEVVNSGNAEMMGNLDFGRLSFSEGFARLISQSAVYSADGFFQE